MAIRTNRANRKLVRIVEGYQAYLVRVSEDLFYVKDDPNGNPLGVPIPSAAKHMSYEQADDLCQCIKKKGYSTTVVTDRYGRMVDLAALEAPRLAEEDRIRKFWESRN